MNFPGRRKPLALILCFGFASVLVGGYSAEVRAQASTPLRVDPVLLGLPPVTPAQASAPAVPRTTVEIKPVEAAEVVATPIDPVPEVRRPAALGKTSSSEIPARSATPQPPPAAVSSAPVPVASPAAVVPVRMPPQAALVVPEAQTAKAPSPSSSAKPVVRSQTSADSATAPLRVDPALLGLPPAVASSIGVASSFGAARSSGVMAASARTSSGRPASTKKSADADKSWLMRPWNPVANAYNNGTWEFLLPLETYHFRSKYTAEKIATYQEKPLGLGVGRGLYNEKGDWEGVNAMAFQDSHFKPMYFAGYSWKSIWRPAEDVRLGLGYNAGLMSRTDILHYIPFPIVLPIASVAYKNFSVDGTWVPGGKGFGNIYFIWAKWEFGKKGEAIGTPAKPVQPEPTEVVNTSYASSGPFVSQKVPYGPVFGETSGVVVGSPSSGIVIPQSGLATSQVSFPDDDEDVVVQDLAPALGLRFSKKMVQPPKESAVPRPVFISAHRMGGQTDRENIAEGEAELRKIGTVVNADRLTYWPIDDEIEAEGNVRLEQDGNLVTGPKMRLKLEDQVGFFEQPSYLFKRQPAPGSRAADNKAAAARFEELRQGDSWLTSGFATPKVLNATAYNSTKLVNSMTEGRGEADRINFEGENQASLLNGTYTTCPVGNDDWYARANELKLDYDREVGEGKDGTIYFKGVPILYSPWLSFSLNNARKSGFLAPTFGTNTLSGFEFLLPYYWNIAPNMDATIAPRVMTKRGMQVNTDVRYLNAAYGGNIDSQLRLEVLPSDSLKNSDSRYGLSLTHRQSTASGFSGLINYNRVSDDTYFTDLSTRVANTSQTQLVQQGMITYSGGGWWNASANFQSYQTLQPDPKNPVQSPYKILPQLTFNARKPDMYTMDGTFLGQYTNFTRSDQFVNGVKVFEGNSGQRTVLYPQVALPYVTPGWYVTPKLGVNATHYALSGQTVGIPGSITRTLPIISVDSGMAFERSSNWFGRDYTQTLEPRLYYLNIPYKNQDQIPVFDTALADFNFAQIFSENQFSSWDRINNANQLTAAVTSRLLEPATGNEIFRAMVGQRFYFSRNKVGLTSTATTSDESKGDRSDLLAAFSGQILPKIFADTAVQYSQGEQQFQRYSIGMRYQPEPGKTLNAAYRYNRSTTAPVDQIDVSGQWPIRGGWYAVGRFNYSFRDDGTVLSTGGQSGRAIESLAGLEYNGGCWAVRTVMRRVALTQDSVSSSFFIQLELNDFSRIGSNPLSILKRSIQGYSLINEPAATPVFGD